MSALSKTEIESRLAAWQGWRFENNAIVRQFTFSGFPDAIAFATRLAFDAQAADHHPDLFISYKRVTVTWTTHDSGGVTEKDFTGARQADAAARGLLPS